MSIENIFYLLSRERKNYDSDFYYYFIFYKTKIKTLKKRLANNWLTNFNKSSYDYIRIISLFFKNSKFLSEAAKMRQARLKQSLSSISIGK